MEAPTEDQIRYRIDELMARDKDLIPSRKERIARAEWFEALPARAEQDLTGFMSEYKIPKLAKKEEVMYFMVEGIYREQFRRNKVGWVKNWVNSKNMEELKKAEANPIFKRRFAEAKEELGKRRSAMAWYSDRRFCF